MGKPLHQAEGEIAATASRIEWFIHNFEECTSLKTVHEANGVTERIGWDPLGTVLNISAWNYPYFVGSNVFAPALLTGNSVLYKPSEITPLTGIKIRELMIKSGLDKDLFQVVVGEGSVGQTLLEYPVDSVFFTGSYGTGKKIAKAVAGKMMKTTMELGGKDPAYVCEDASLEKVVDELASGVFYNAGQSCCSVERIYVHEGVYERFVELFYTKAMSLKVGDPMDSQTYMGPLARREQINFLDDQREDAVKKGAVELISGGFDKDEKGWFYKPCVLLNTDHSMSIMKDESFGPVVGIMKVGSDERSSSFDE